jgi:hypothetical protein
MVSRSDKKKKDNKKGGAADRKLLNDPGRIGW